jgi:CubicO group peptidase (beta-lactamase class C family)
MIRFLRLAVLSMLAAVAASVSCHAQSATSDMDNYIRPYADSHNFAGSVLVVRGGDIIFDRAYGFANIEKHIENKTTTSYHIASLSKAYTAALVLHLIDKRRLSLDNTVQQFVPGIPNGERITIRNLLEETSGLPDADEQSGSAYNLLARIVAVVTDGSFADAMSAFLFSPHWMTGSGVDDDDLDAGSRYALGYAPQGVSALQAAPAIHWSAKVGNGSVYATTRDELRFVQALFEGDLLNGDTRAAMMDTSRADVGYGWFKRQSKTLGGSVFSMTGRAAGFASYVLYLPGSDVIVIVLGNINSAATSTIGQDLAAIALGRPYAPLKLNDGAPSDLADALGGYVFGKSFDRPGTLTLLRDKGGAGLRWPDGEVSPLIPLGPDKFVDRTYWEPVEIRRGPDGRPVELLYEGAAGKKAAASPGSEPQK